MTKHLSLISAGAILAAGAAQANVLDPIVLGLRDAGGNLLTNQTRTMVIIDQDGDGLTGFANWDGSSFLADSDDVILSAPGLGDWDEITGDETDFGFEDPNSAGALATAILDPAVVGGYDFDSAGSTGDNNAVDVGDGIYLFWFPGLNTGAAAPGAEQEFGVVLLGNVTAGPTDIVVVDSALSAEANLQGVNNALVANQQTVPEPTSLALLGLGGLLVARRRRG